MSESYTVTQTNIWWIMLERFLEWLKVKNYSPKTIVIRRRDVGKLIKFLEERELVEPREITLSHLERYQAYLANYLTKKNKHLQADTQGRILTALKVFFRYLAKEKYLTFNPATEIECPKIPSRLPKTILSHQEVELIMKQADLTTLTGQRDRAVLELLYSTGIRRAELANLKLKDLDNGRAMIFVREGKCAKDRCIPIGERALAWVERYLREVRPQLVAKSETKVEALFINQYGEGFSIDGIANVVEKYVSKAGIGKRGACHIFRHTMATLMLENGADIRYIQQMLGHTDIATTQIYTQVSDRMLREVHSQTHPGAKLFSKKYSSPDK